MIGLEIMDVIVFVAAVAAAFVLGFSIGIILERKKMSAEYEWDAGVHDRLNKIEELVNVEYHHVERQLEKFRHELSYTQKFLSDELESGRITMRLPDASDSEY
tara:strand:+ start:2558 stop:2866 length:309 start_codon:yes stop_codon:yes gene_type:complete